MIAANSTGVTDVGATVFRVTPDYTGDGTGTFSKITANLICTTGVAGMPVIITVDPELDLASGYIIELTARNRFGLRRTEASGDSVPVYPATYTGVLVSSYVLEITAPSLKNGNTDKIYVPVGADTTLESIRLFSRSNNVESEILSVYFSSTNRAVIGNDPIDNTEDLTVGIAGNLVVNIEGMAIGDYIGFADLDLAVVALTGNSIESFIASETIILTEDDDDFIASAVFVRTQEVLGVAKFSVTPKSCGNFGAVYLGVPNSGACYQSKALDVYATPGSLRVAISPTTVAENAAGFDFTVAVTTTNAVPEGGELTFTVNSAFAILADGSCEVSGVHDMVDGTTPICVIYYSSVVTVSTFGALAGGSTVTITFTDAKGGAAAGTVNCLSSDPTTTDGTNDIDTLTAATNDCTVSAELDPVHATSFSASFYPNASGVKADVYITFKSSRELPSGTTLNFYYSGTKKVGTTCWANFDFSACTVSVGGIEFTTSEGIAASSTIEVYVDNAIIPSLTDPPEYFKVTAIWQTVYIVDDSDTTGGRTVTTHTVTVNSAVTEMTTAPTVTPSVISPGVYSNYQFTYTPTVGVESTDVLWFSFPPDFDPHIGYAEKTFEASGDTHRYMSCKFGETDVECYVDHYIVFLTGIAVPSSTQITITIENIINPIGTLHTLAYYLLDSDNILKEYSDSITLTLSSDIPSHITIKSMSPTSHILNEYTQYTVQFYTSTGVTLGIEDKPGLQFPQQFNLDSVPTPRCDFNFTIGGDETALNGQCTQQKDTFWFSIPVHSCIGPNDLASFTLSPIPNPQVAFTRDYHDATESAYDIYHDAIEAGLFTVYAFWTEQFGVMIEQNGVITHQSTENTNSAYVGLSDSDIGDDYSIHLVTEDRITVCKGTTSDWYFIQPADNMPAMVDISITGSVSELTLNQPTTLLEQLDTALTYTVSASIEAPEDVYILEWTVTDELNECSDDLYGPLSYTLVEVYNCDIQTVHVHSSIRVIGTSSAPVRIWLDKAPAYNLTIQLVWTDPTNYTLSHDSITFLTGEHDHYFYVTSAADVDEVNTIVYTVKGTDAAAYQIVTSSTVEHEDSPADVDPLTVSLSTSSNSATASVYSSSSGTVFWYLKCSQDTDLDHLPAVDLAALQELIDDQLERTDDEREGYYDDMSAIDLFNRMIHDHCSTFVYGAEVIEGSMIEIEIDGLSDETTYTFGAYLVDTDGNSPPDQKFSAANDTATTHAGKALRTVALDISGSSSVAGNETTISCTVAKHMHIPLPFLHLESMTDTETTDNATTNTNLVYTVVYDRFDASHSPSSYTSMVHAEDLESDLEYLLESEVNISSISYSTRTFSEGNVPMFIVPPPEEQNSTERRAITMKATADRTGYWCTACILDSESDAKISPTGWQVFYGLSVLSNAADGYECTETTPETEVSNRVSRLTAESDFFCYHALCTTNWHTPNCVISPTVTLATTGSYLLLALSGWVLALIFT